MAYIACFVIHVAGRNIVMLDVNTTTHEYR
jgi:hypothetical protein